MSNTLPPSLRKTGTPQQSDNPNETASSLSKWGQSIKTRLGEIQTKPDFMERVQNFRLGEVQTKPIWMTRKPQPTVIQDGEIQWIRIIPFAGQKYVTEKFPSKLGSMQGVIHFRFFKDERSQIHIYAGHSSGEKLRKALRQRIPNTDLQDTEEPPVFNEKFVNRVGELGGVLNEKGNLEAILDALEDETYLNIAFEERPEHEFKQPLRDFVYGGGIKSSSKQGGVLDNLATINDVFNPFSAKNVTAAGGTPLFGKKYSARNDTKASKRDLSTEERDQTKRIENLLSETTNYFRVVIKIGAKHPNHIQPIFNELNSQLKQQHRFSIAGNEKKKHWKNTKHSPDVLWRENELNVLVALPDMTNEQMLRSVPHMKPGERTLRDDELTSGIAVGRLIHPVKAPRVVKIPTKQFLRHFFMGGKNGSGKSSTAVQMIQSLLDEWGKNPEVAPGFTYVDPASSTLTIILNRLLHMEKQGIRIPWEKVHYLDLTPESEYPVGLNLLYHTPGEDYASVSSSVLDVIKSAYGSDAVFTERLIENGVMTLLYDQRMNHTILGLTSVLQYPAMREDIHVLDPLVQEFWDMTGEDLKPKSLDPLLNRLRPLLQKPSIRRIFGQTRWTLNIREWMDEGHIVLINTLNLESKNVGLVGGQVLMRYHVTAKSRPADISKSHMLMIDEAHLVQIPILEKVIAEDRKFGLSLGLITQFPEQFDGLLLKSIAENMGTFLTCTLGPGSAGVMAKMMNGAFDPSTLQGLPTSRVAAYTSIDGAPFSFMVKSDPPVIYMPSGKLADYENPTEMAGAQNWALEKAKALASRDGAHRDEVDQEINSYMQYLRQFRQTEEEESKERLNSKLKVYKPAESEQPILDVIVELVGELDSWGGYTKSLLMELGDYLDDEIFDDISPAQLGSLLSRAESWFAEKNIKTESSRKEKGTYWNIKYL